ncbi:MAG: hypothetical protein ACRECR_05140 [Thermoplasmata archaeon]
MEGRFAASSLGHGTNSCTPHRLHFSEALIYSTARRFGAVLYTSDPALKGLDRVTVL